MSKNLNSTPVGEPVTVDGMWGTRKRIAEVKKFNFVLCGVKLGVFHDSKLNKSIFLHQNHSLVEKPCPLSAICKPPLIGVATYVLFE